MDCRVVLEAGVPVYDVETTDAAMRIAIAKTGKMVNPDLSFVDITPGGRTCPHCGTPLDPAVLCADESLVALELTMDVFNVEDETHARRVARAEIGKHLSAIPLTVRDTEVIENSD